MESTEKQLIALIIKAPEGKPIGKSWVCCEIKKALYSSDIVSGQSHTKLLKHVEFIWIGESDQTSTYLQTWFSKNGGKYDSVVAYLRPTGNLIAAVKESKIPCKISTAMEYPSPPWMDYPDSDDCLADFNNLQMLKMNIRNEVLKRWVNKSSAADCKFMAKK